MWKNSHQWRATVEGVGIDELYKEIDPFDVSIRTQTPRSVYAHLEYIANVPSSTQNVITCLTAGRCTSTRYVSC